MSWHTWSLLGFDTETTGVDTETARIVTAAFVRINPDRPLWTDKYLIAVDVDIPEQATAVHGITTEYAREHGHPAVDVLNPVADALRDAVRVGTPIVGFNVSYDLTLLDRELRRNNLPTLPERIGGPIAPVVDVHVIDKAVDPFRPGSRKLVDTAKAYGVRTEDIDAHDAAGDARLAARVAYRMGQISQAPAAEVAQRYADRRRPLEIAGAFADLGRMDLGQLHRAQVNWRAAQMNSLRQYFDRQGTEHDGCDPSWPMRPHPSQQEVTV